MAAGRDDSPDESGDCRRKGEDEIGKASWLTYAEGLWIAKSRVPRFFSVCGQICGQAENAKLKKAGKVLIYKKNPGFCRRFFPVIDVTISAWARLSVLTNYSFCFLGYSIFSYLIAAFPCAPTVSRFCLLWLVVNYCKPMLPIFRYMLPILLPIFSADLIPT